VTADDFDSTPAVLAAVERESGAPCRGCGNPVCGHEVVASHLLGFKGAPRCQRCLARGLDRTPDEFGAELRARVDHRDCWRAGWRRADELDRIAPQGRRACALAESAAGIAAPAERERTMATASGSGGASPPRVDAEWDAGDLGCGDLVLELRIRLNAMRSGQVLRLTARDPGASQDLPAWCGLTGHALVHADPPIFFIRRKE
jgi:tRNA 2-thiouridine synthesizing protein A